MRETYTRDARPPRMLVHNRTHRTVRQREAGTAHSPRTRRDWPTLGGGGETGTTKPGTCSVQHDMVHVDVLDAWSRGGWGEHAGPDRWSPQISTRAPSAGESPRLRTPGGARRDVATERVQSRDTRPRECDDDPMSVECGEEERRQTRTDRSSSSMKSKSFKKE